MRAWPFARSMGMATSMLCEKSERTDNKSDELMAYNIQPSGVYCSNKTFKQNVFDLSSLGEKRSIFNGAIIVSILALNASATVSIINSFDGRYPSTVLAKQKRINEEEIVEKIHFYHLDLQTLYLWQ